MKKTRIPPSHQQRQTSWLRTREAKELNWGLHGGQKEI